MKSAGFDLAQLAPDAADYRRRLRMLTASATLPAEDGLESIVTLVVFHDRSEKLAKAYRAVLYRRTERVDPDAGTRTAVHVRGGDPRVDLFSVRAQEWDEAKLRDLYGQAFEATQARCAAGDATVAAILGD